MNDRLIFTDEMGDAVELVALIGKHVVTYSRYRGDDRLYLNNTMIAWDKLDEDTYAASEMFEQLTGFHPHEFQGIRHPAGNDCGCPCNCKFRGYSRGDW